MRTLHILLCVLVLAVSSSWCDDLLVGSGYEASLIWEQKAEYLAIPFKKRVKQVFYSDPNQRVIKGIIAKDLDNTSASATVTAGGVGFTYVNLRLKGESGKGLNFQIQVYSAQN